MALAFDTSSNQTDEGSVTTLSWSHTCTGSELVLIVAFACYGDGGIAVTYNSVAMTLVQASDVTTGAGRQVFIFKLIAPSTGANTVSITGMTSGKAGGYAASFTGADQFTGVDTPAQATGSSTTPTIDISSSADEIVIDIMVSDNNPRQSITVGAGQTQMLNSNPVDLGFGGSRETGSSTTTMSWTLGGSDDWAVAAVAVLPPQLPIQGAYIL